MTPVRNALAVAAAVTLTAAAAFTTTRPTEPVQLAEPVAAMGAKALAATIDALPFAEASVAEVVVARG
jgi:hypothetical protein